MDRKSNENMRMDRRLIGRKNWTAPKEVEREIEALPDVSHKIAVVEEESESTDADAPTADSSTPSQN